MPVALVRSVVRVADAVLGEPGAVLSASEEREMNRDRMDDPYFHAFRSRCLQWVYGDDPRRALEQERIGT